MNRTRFTLLLVWLGLSIVSSVQGQQARSLNLLYADQSEFIFSKLQDSTFVSGSVIFETESGLIYCDSAMWAKGERVILWGKVIIDDKDFRLVADTVDYDLVTNRAVARGDYVELLSRNDSLYAVGTHAFFDRDRDYFYMMNRPTVYLNYPDSARMIEIIADFVEYDGGRSKAEAEGSVKISSDQFNSTSGCAVMHLDRHTLDLFDSPRLIRKRSEISGRFISVLSGANTIEQIDVIDSAYAEFVEPTDRRETKFDRSILSGDRILLDFVAGDLRTATCNGQAYSWYLPASHIKTEQVENKVSGDTVRFTVANEQLRQVEIIGGAVGAYMNTTITYPDTSSTLESDTDFISSEPPLVDTAILIDSLLPLDSSLARNMDTVRVTDTIDYSGDYIVYDLHDSVITLRSRATTTTGEVALEAFEIQLDLKDRIIEAYSAQLVSDSADEEETDNQFVSLLQPNPIPVILKDGDQNLVGDFLRYSIETEKGRIVTSKSDYETGFFYSENLYRQDRDIFYLENGRYTTCNADEPHFHFKSSNLKLINGKKLIAKPVVFHLGRLPLLALPYYVFPLEKGRHSGILPFSLGNIERGERYIRNVGYYWAASEYWDWQGALDYYEERDRLNMFSRVNYRKLYAFNGSISGNWGRETAYDDINVQEFRNTRWTLKANHTHEFSPSFKLSATGNVQSDATYYNDYSTNLAERLNRVVRSRVNFTKRFGNNVSVSGSVSHDDYLDKESRTDHLPSLGVSLPSFRPFGSGSLNEEGKLERHWYNELIVTYRPRLENFSSRNTLDSTLNTVFDTTFTVDTSIVILDSLTMTPDTTIFIDTIVVMTEDTLSYRSRKKYTRVDHTASINFPLTIAKYFVFNPRFGYSENWFRIHQTDQSDVAGIDASTNYRAYRYDMGASFSTKLYGTIYPNIFGISGLRQVLLPTVSYRYAPKIDRHPNISSYAGGSARSSSKSRSLSVGLNHTYQAKLRRGESERNLELASVSHSFNYDFERDSLRFSNLSTRVSSNLLRHIRLNASMTHSLYKSPGSSEVDFWNPHLMDFRANGTVTLRGSRFLFDDIQRAIPRGAPELDQLGLSEQSPFSSGGQGWDVSATYNYSESGKWSGIFRKTSSVRMSLHFNLTPTTKVTYSQYYDIVGKKTVSNQVSIVKIIHCWTGTFHWVPTGSTKGWGFRLFVTAMPAIKIDNSQNSLNSSYLQSIR